MRNRRNDRTTPRKPSNPRTDSSLRQARDRWLAENTAAIKAYNAQVAELGVFADTPRRF